VRVVCSDNILDTLNSDKTKQKISINKLQSIEGDFQRQIITNPSIIDLDVLEVKNKSTDGEINSSTEIYE
jgi:hypothetical protein